MDYERHMGYSKVVFQVSVNDLTAEFRLVQALWRPSFRGMDIRALTSTQILWMLAQLVSLFESCA
jgi:hypothetical protein